MTEFDVAVLALGTLAGFGIVYIAKVLREIKNAVLS